MTKTDIIDRIRAHEADLRQLGLRSLMLFGSMARGTATPASDVDFLYEFEENEATLEHFLELKALLETLLGCSVDLISNRYASPHFRRSIRGQLERVL